MLIVGSDSFCLRWCRSCCYSDRHYGWRRGITQLSPIIDPPPHPPKKRSTNSSSQIYATVGSEEKVDYLVQNFNIPQSHIFHSHDTSFVADLMRHTNNCGVDIVLNSLSGELLRASWDCVAEFGKMIELGKRDIVDFGSLPMINFMQSRSYCCVDLTHLVQKRSKHAAG